MTDYSNRSIPLLPNESWWGGLSALGASMPFRSESTISCDLLNENLGNQAQPLLVSNRGRYVWSDHPFHFEFKQGSLHLSKAHSEIHLFEEGNSLKEAFCHASRNHFPASGSIPDPILFNAPQYNTWIELMYDQREEKILEYAESIIAAGYPPGTILIDDNWQEDYGTWEFSARRFSDPKAMIEKLHDMGFKVMLWVCPFVSADSATCRELAEKHFLHPDEQPTQDILWANTEFKPALIRWWNGASAMIDLSNPDAREWFRLSLQKLVDEYGIDGFKFDAGDPAFYSGVPSQNLSFLPTDHSEQFAAAGLPFAFNEYRACWKMAGQPLVQRLQDKKHKWEDLRTLIPCSIAQGLMGYAFTCPDMIGGGEYLSFLRAENIDQELIVRSAQAHALMPMMQFSLAPWRVLDPEKQAICLEMAKLHTRTAPRILEYAHRSANTGEPIIKSLEWFWPGRGYDRVVDQFILGEDILVCPVLEKGAESRSVILPPGTWTADDGTRYEGEQTIQVEAPLDRLPWFEREIEKN
ncbi:glycoside hydrolase family 31 protein [Puniceicoccus vermicola]|uniref:Glycoside hydrolase n=1 Tax=Puniceicoccus vermicola TaxID=388746 RepID=A0A7X1AXX0_9BACT|nr:glycoside hydrolase family 31 protein [Puniceicoccus vermicola]MBC2601809.1 glycoside hydrolase [Puniceicoccus vermicola]